VKSTAIWPRRCCGNPCLTALITSFRHDEPRLTACSDVSAPGVELAVMVTALSSAIIESARPSHKAVR
jgi:hypothetical protein